MNDTYDEEDDPLGLGPVDEEIARQRAANGFDLPFGAEPGDPLEIIRQEDPILAEYLGKIEGDPSGWERPLDLLLERGLVIPSAEKLDEAALHEKLWEVIWALAELGCYLYSTNHLTDRQLYTKLITDTLCEDTVLMPGHLDYACHFDLAGDSDSEDWLRFYADDKVRSMISEEEPGRILPPHEPPPFDRDKDLPQRPEPLWASSDDDDDDENDDDDDDEEDLKF